MSTKQAYPCQEEAVHAIIEALGSAYTRILLKKPTGVGKTYTCKLLLSDPNLRRVLNVPQDRPLRVLYIAHMRQLLKQAAAEFADIENVEFIWQSAFSVLPKDVVWDFVVIDECHHEAMYSVQKQLATLCKRPMLGMTATDERPDGLLIKFDKCVETITRREAVEQGYIVESAIRSIIDYNNNTNDVEEFKEFLSEYAPQMKGTIIFVSTNAIAAEITQYLKELGYSAAHCLEDTLEQLEKFNKGEVQFLVNCQKLLEGVDLKQVHDVVFRRTVGSIVQLNQGIGRTVRKDCESVIWEFVSPIADTLHATDVTGRVSDHKLIYQQNGTWHEIDFELSPYV